MSYTFTIIEPDSGVFGQNIVEITSFSDEQDANALEAEIRDMNALYAYCKLPDTRLNQIHILENLGFRFIESQFEVQIDIDRSYNAMLFYPYKIDRVSSPKDMEEIYRILRENPIENRVSSDPDFPNNLGYKRYCAYLEKSFSDPNEELYKIYLEQDDQIIGFQSNAITNRHQSRLLLSGVRSAFKDTLSGINYLMHFDALRKNGIRLVTTWINGHSFREMNYEISGFDFQITQHLIVLRKVY